MELLESGYDWDYPIEPQESGNSYMRHARAKVLGGCSSHNSAIAFWAPRENLDDWAAQRGDGLDRRRVLPLLPQARDRAGRRRRRPSAPGPRHRRTGDHPHRRGPGPVRRGAARAACEQVGLPTTPFNTGRTVLRGANWFQVNAKPDGTRSRRRRRRTSTRTSSRAQPHADDRLPGREAEPSTRPGRARAPPASRLRTPDTAARDRRDRPPRDDPLVGGHRRAEAADALGHRAGRAPARGRHRRRSSTAPGVGENLQDHPEGLVQWEALQTMPTVSTQWWQIGIFAGSEGRDDART